MPPPARPNGRYGIGVGSGLILLLIVGMWLAVLVPMWLKSYDSGANLSSVDRFSDAMRVLSRRHVAMGDRRTLLMPPRPRAVLSGGPGAQVPAATERAARIQAALARTVPSAVPAPVPPARPGAERPTAPDVAIAPVTATGPTAAARRLRTLYGLLGAAALTLLLALLGPGLLLPVHLLVDALLLGFVVHCRRLAVLRADRAPSVPVVRPAARPDRPLAAPPLVGRSLVAPALTAPALLPRALPLAASVPVLRVAGIPDRMPSRPAALTTFVPAQSTRRADPLAARPVPVTAAASAASVRGEPWSPVPVPVPIYVGLPAAASPAARVVDLTHPGKWSDNLAAADDGLRHFADDTQLDEIVGRRRAAGDW